PIEDILVLDRKIELLTWSVQEMDAEVAALREYRKILEQGTQVYSFIKSIDKWYWRLRKLAYSVTKVERSSQILKRIVSKNAQYRKQKRITGKRGFHIDFGCAIGPDAWAAAAQIGLSISLSGALAVDDDRRLRANVTLKLVPSFECKISGGGNDLFKFSAKLGFTITNQTYAFVDEHHFALYIAFRIANLLNFTDKFTKYGRASLHQHIGLYSDEVKSILEKIVGRETMTILEWYLTKQAVVKAHFPTGKKWVPSADIGFSEGVLGLGAQASTSYKPQVFTKTRLEIPEKSKAATKEPTQAAKKFWEYTAYGDGNCLYYSLSFLLDHYGIGSPDDQALRGHAAAALRQLIRDNLQKVAADRDPIWVIDTTKYPGGLDDLVQKTGHTSEYADLPAICALAHHFRMTIAVHRPTTPEVIELRAPRHLLDPNKYVDVIFRGGNHYNPLIPKTGAAAPQAKLVPIRGATGGTPVQVVAAPAEISSGYQKFSTKDGTGQKSELDRQTTRRAQRTEERAASPKLITATRSGYTFSGSGNISGSTWVKIKAELGYTRIWHNANPDNDGKYLNIKITNALFSRTVTNDPPPDPVFSSTDRQTIHDRYGDTAGTDPEKHLANAIPEGLVKDFFKSTFASVSDKFAELKCDLGAVAIDYNRSTRSLEWNLVRTYGTWRVQYMRWTYASSLDVAVDVPVQPGISITGGFGWSKMVALDERLGTHTLTYVITVFNGLKLRFSGRRQWDEFFEKHRYRFRDIFRRIGRSAERAENDERLATAYEETKDLSDLVDERHDWWKDQENDKWVHISDRGNATCRFLEDCKAGWSRLDLKWSSRHPTHGFRKITREASAELEMLFEKFTTLLWRATRCTAMLNARHAPWKEKYAYLVPAHG
ncbi:MAG: hypothetical protein IID33_14120, partial [Planctomycetes bacterium]|nr:hypothetical protein [Planctomycetota bacterium]